MLDLQNNSNQADNRLVWVPFHFLPGNEPGPAGANSKDDILYRMMCKPDSEIARRMVIDCIQRKQLPFALHRLGIALHTYVDTWAHQQFVTHASKSLDIFYRVASAMNKFFSIRAFLLLLATTTIMYWISP
jgi:hypothetical protein